MIINLDISITFKNMISDKPLNPLILLLPKEVEDGEVTYIIKEVKIPMSIDSIDTWLDKEYVDFIYYILENIVPRNVEGKFEYFTEHDFGVVKESTSEYTIYENFTVKFKYK